MENKDLYNVALFIDYENVYRNLLEENRNVIREGFFEKIREWCSVHKRRLVKIAVYCNYDNEDLHESYHQSLLQSYGVETIHTSNQGKNFADLQITIDVLNAMYLNSNIDEFMIMSNDKDMTPLLNNIRYNKRKVSVITVGEKYNNAICSFSDEQIKYEDVIQTEIVQSHIDAIESKIEKNLISLFKRNKNRPGPFQHIGIDYFANLQTKSCCLMIYEIYTCLKNLSDNNKICLYNYEFRNNNYIGICPVEEKEHILETCHIEESSFTGTGIENLILEQYAKYKRT